MSWQPDGWQPDGWQPEGWQPEVGDTPYVEPNSRAYFRARIEQRFFRARQTVNDSEYTFDPVEKDPNGQRKVELDLYEMCVNRWRANEQRDQNEFIRPSRPNGFSYECTTAGTSGAREPVWPTAIGATITDGSCTWTCRAASSNGINAITSPSAVSDPSGLTIEVEVNESWKLRVTYPIGGADGEDYEAVFTFTQDGVTRVARQRLLIRKQ